VPSFAFNPTTGELDLVTKPKDLSLSFIAAATISKGDVVALLSTGEVAPADATFSIGLWRVFGIAETSVLAASMVRIATFVGRRVEVNFTSPPSAVNNGDYAFLSTTPGKVALTPPLGTGKVRFVVGVLVGADGLDTNPTVLYQPAYFSRSP
jgi:hypothetical protein